MSYYWLLLILILFINYINKKNLKRNNTPLFVCISLFFLFFAFRVGFTPDYYNYEALFYKYHPSSFLDDRAAQELGFQWLCQILPSYRILVVLHTALFCFCLFFTFIVIKSDKQYWWLAWTILFCYTSFVLGNMSGMRSGSVTCFFFLALLVKVKTNNIIGIGIALGLMLVAFTQHRSAVVMVPLLFITSKPYKKYILYIIYTIATVFIFISLFIPNVLNDAAYYLTLYYFDDYNYTSEFENSIDSSIGIFQLIKTTIVIYLLYTTLDYEQKEKDFKKNIFLKLTAFYYVLVLAPSNIGLISRFYYYFAFPCMIGSVVTVKNLPKKKRGYYIASIALYALYQIYYFYRKGSIYHYLNYNTILF